VSDIWPDCMNWNLDRNGAAFSCKGYGALLKERDALAERLAEEVESHAITSANLERLQNRWDKRPVVDDLQARLAEVEREIARIREITDGCEWCAPYAGAADSATAVEMQPGSPNFDGAAAYERYLDATNGAEKGAKP
jgi:hypothetical protein